MCTEKVTPSATLIQKWLRFHGECNHERKKKDQRLGLSECGRKMKEMEMPNGRGVECNPAVVVRLHLF
jgi:hypothetical protein